MYIRKPRRPEWQQQPAAGVSRDKLRNDTEVDGPGKTQRTSVHTATLPL